jgi:hypothetical protein
MLTISYTEKPNYSVAAEGRIRLGFQTSLWEMFIYMLL